MAAKKKFAIIAHQRTGTHLLASLLRASPDVFMYDEVLMPTISGGAHGHGLFFQYYQKLLEKDWSKLLITNFYTFDEVFKGFFEQASENVSEPVVGFDLKIDQVQTFPRLFWSLQNWEFSFIHLVRRNYLARMASHLVMNKRMEVGDTDLHHTKQGRLTVRMDVNRTIWWMISDLEANRQTEEKLSRAGDAYIKIFYEEIAAIDPRPIRRVFHTIGSTLPEKLVPGTIKQADRPLSEVIENFDEIVAEIDKRGLMQDLAPLS